MDNSPYHKPCPKCQKALDLYDILEMYNPPHAIAHAVKKLLVLGKRSGGKTAIQDAKEAIWSIKRWIEQWEAEEKRNANIMPTSQPIPHNLGTTLR